MHMLSDINRNIYSNPFYLINISHLIKRNSALPISQLPIAYWLLPVVLRFLQFVVFASCLFPDSCLYSCNGPIHRVMGFLRPWPRAWGQGFAAEGPGAGWGWGPQSRGHGNRKKPYHSRFGKHCTMSVVTQNMQFLGFFNTPHAELCLMLDRAFLT